MKRRFTEGHWSPYSGKAAEYVHRIQDNVDTIHTNCWILNPKYGFAWKEDNRGWVSVMKPKVFRVAGEKRYGYQVYGLSKDGTLRDKSSDWWDTPEEAQENIKRIFKIDMAQESTRGNMKMKRRIMKEGSSGDKELIKTALDSAIKAKQLLDDAATTIRDAAGETFLFARLDSHSMDLDDTIDDIKAVLAGELDDTVDATDGFENPFLESRKRFDSKFVKESSNYNDKSLKELMTKVERYGGACQSLARNGALRKDTKYDQKMAAEFYNDIYEYAKPFMSYTACDGKEEFEESGAVEDETEWFDSHGDMKKHLPMDCILDCSSGGRVDDEVDYWVSELNFKVPVDRGLSYVREYGLDDIGPEEVDKYVLWIMCGNVKDEAFQFCRDGSEWDYVDKDAYPEDIDDWGEEDWERFQSEVAVCHLGM